MWWNHKVFPLLNYDFFNTGDRTHSFAHTGQAFYHWAIPPSPFEYWCWKSQGQTPSMNLIKWAYLPSTTISLELLLSSGIQLQLAGPAFWKHGPLWCKLSPWELPGDTVMLTNNSVTSRMNLLSDLTYSKAYFRADLLGNFLITL